jgi:OmpA family
MKKKAKKVMEAGKSPWAYHKFFSTFVICLTALVLMSSFNKNDVTSLVNAKACTVPGAKLLHIPDEPVVYTIRFEFESAAITPEAAVILNQLIKMLKADKTLQVNIEGHADKFYDENYNLKISAQRANNVRKFLLFRNIAKDRVTTAFAGSAKPDPKNTHTPWLDRRADITVYKK